MNHIRACGFWGLAVVAFLLSPMAVILAVPLLVGIGLDIIDLTGEMPVALALCAPVAFVLLRRLSETASLPRMVARVRSAHHLGQAADLNYAP